MAGVSNNVKIIKRYSEALKRKLVEEIEGGRLTVGEAMRHYGIEHRRTVNGWIWKYGQEKHETKIVRIMMKSEVERIRELEKALADERLVNMVKTEQLKIYEEWVPDIKKKLNTKQLKEFEAREEKIKSFR
jgi:transposase